MNKQDTTVLEKLTGKNFTGSSADTDPAIKSVWNHHIHYHRNGAWIREAAEAYKNKKNKKQPVTV